MWSRRLNKCAGTILLQANDEEIARAILSQDESIANH